MGRSRDEDDVVTEIKGRSVTVFWGGSAFQPSQWGSARLTVTPTHLIESTKFFITSRETTIPLEQISGVTLLSTGNPFMLILTPLCGLGLLLFLLFRIRYVVVYAPNTVAVIAVTGKEDAARDFIDELLAEIGRAKKKSSGGSSAPAAPTLSTPSRPPSDPAPERVTSAPAKTPTPKPVRCPECDKEYRIPAGSGGKKFRCQSCQAVIDVPADF
ncbi:MAG: hypothetical protein EBV06_02930 [Planctomycetia bacterium]|nr:hypothetical protein [Planctomycetia bacterium]